METKEEIITQLRIDVEVLKVQEEAAREALKLAHSNTIAWAMAAIGITSLILTVILKGHIFG